MIYIFNEWKNEVEFDEEIKNEQEYINLFLTDLAKGEKYKKIKNEMNLSLNKFEYDIETSLIKPDTDLSKYELRPDAENVLEIRYRYKSTRTEVFTLKNLEKYKLFWKTYHRPPSLESFEKILEHKAKLYTDKYRKTTGAKYTPYFFVKKQNEFIEKYYGEAWQYEYIVYDPCCGVGNLENEFPKEFKQKYCFMSTLEQGDIDVCKIKYFENSLVFDYLKDDSEPKFLFQGEELNIKQIAERTGRKLMIIMNPPYQRVKGHKNNLAIEFYNKVCKLSPETIIFYYQTESFLRDEIDQYINSKYKIVSHIMSNAKTTFLLSEWPISQVIFDKTKGEEIDKDNIKASRYEYDNVKDEFKFIKTYTYNNKPNLIKEIEKEIVDNTKGGILGQWSYITYVLVIGNGGKEKDNKITTENLKYCLLSKGINFCSHQKWFEQNRDVFKGEIKDISEELCNDGIMYSLFYKNNQFENKPKNGLKNYIMPYTAEEIGSNVNDLNILTYYVDENDIEIDINKNDIVNNNKITIKKTFDFRYWLHHNFSMDKDAKKTEFSSEAMDLYWAALEIFKFYHSTFNYVNNGFQKSMGADFNDSFYDITNAIMGKSNHEFTELDAKTDTRMLYKVKTTKGTKGFGRGTIKKRLAEIGHIKVLPIFINFFDKRDILAKKINKMLVDSGLLLWERENIF